MIDLNISNKHQPEDTIKQIANDEDNKNMQIKLLCQFMFKVN